MAKRRTLGFLDFGLLDYWTFPKTSALFWLIFVSTFGLFDVSTSAQFQSVVNSPHNLSASGPGAVRALTEEQVCIFCHTPHSASPIRPLWNRHMPINAYSVYTSNSLDAVPGQPTGTSKLCLSCHDGTIALGSVFSRDQIIQMSGGITTLPPGHANLGTDLSDDHPISFRYDTALWIKDPQLADPRTLPIQIKLDFNQELQCTSCHDAHNNIHGDFLVMSNLNSALCNSCHNISSTSVPTHTDCVSCHKTHTAPSGPYLLKQDRISNTCTSCHDGSRPDAWNILADLNKVSRHDTNSRVDPPDPIPGHATCADCHEPHTMGRNASNVSTAPRVWPNFGTVTGLSSSGARIPAAQNEYEVCYKCHADQNAITSPRISRQVAQYNMRLQFDPAAISFHPVEAPGRNMNVPSLRPGWTPASMVYCSDCHNSDTGRKAGGVGPNGVHGSNESPLLIARYETNDFAVESFNSYALCYRCHERDGPGGVLNDESFPYHRLHVVDARTPCSACHDSHGISSAQGSTSNHTHLINFDTTIVLPDRVTGLLRFEDQGLFRGSCTLTCHNVDHSPKTY